MFLLFPLFPPGWTKAGLPDGKVWARQRGISIQRKDLESENLVAVPAMPPMTVNLAQGLAHCKHSTNMSPISSSIFFPLPFCSSAPVRHAGLLSLRRTCHAYSCFKAAELALPSAGYVPPTDHPMAFYSLLVLISNATTKRSLPTLGHSLTYYPDGFSSWLLSLSLVTLMIYLFAFIISLPVSTLSSVGAESWLLWVYQHWYILGAQ